MLAIELAKLPPPSPARQEIAANTQNGVPPLVTAIMNAIVGISSRTAEMIVQLRPPNFGTAKVYGIRRNEPIRFGREVSRKSWLNVKLKAGFWVISSGVVTDHSSQIEKPRCSAKIDQIKL